MNRGAIEKLLHQTFPRKANALCKLLKESARLKTERAPESAIRIGQSKFGGWPDVPLGFQWPRLNGRPLAFLLQLNCGDIRAAAPTLPVPEQGLISVFYDVEKQPWGFDPKDGESKQVELFGATGELTRFSASGIPDAIRIPTARIGFGAAHDLPSWEEPQLEKLGLSDEETEKLDALRGKIAGSDGGHQLFGWPWLIQGAMQEECQLASNGVYVGDSNGYQSKAAKKLLAENQEWMMWLQVDSDDSLKLMWGDVGRIYFWIRKEDLESAKFDRSWLVLQCS